MAPASTLRKRAEVLRLETLSEADGRPLSRATSYFDAARFAGFEKAYAETRSITASFREFGVDDYLRRSTIVSARHADPADLADLRLSPGAIVLVTVAVNEDTAGTADPVFRGALRRGSGRVVRFDGSVKRALQNRPWSDLTL